ncbi:MAG: YceI family protein [Myxococcaceae bacterium]
MKKMLIVAALTVSSMALASNWKIDAAHTSATFAVKHMMVSTVKGTLGTVSGTIALDDKDASKSKLSVSIDPKTLETGVTDRNNHLKSPDFFDVEKFPAVTFTSKSVKIDGAKATIVGDLKIKDATKEVTLTGELTPEVANLFTKVPTRGFSGTASINRKDFGLTWNKAMEAGGVLVGDEVKIMIEAEMTKDEPAAAPAKAPPAKK